MKSKVLFIVFSLVALISFSQDEIVLHNGSTMKAKVTNLNASDGVTVAFIVEGETLTTELSKFAIKDILFASGRKQTITEKININQGGTKSPDKIVITRNPKEILGLTRIGEVQSKTAFINYRTGANADRKAEDRIKDAAHDMDGVVVLITEDKDYNVGNINKKKLGSAQVRMTGIAYKY
jgi:hypothetical protein